MRDLRVVVAVVGGHHKVIVGTSVCFVEGSMYSAHVSSAQWTGPSLKTRQCLFLFLSLPLYLNLMPARSPPPVHSEIPLLCSRSFTHLLTAKPFWPLPLSVPFIPSLHPFPLCSRHILPKDRDECRRLQSYQQLACEFKERGGERKRNVEWTKHSAKLC